MSTFSTCTLNARPDSPANGDVLFETDTNNVIVYDGTAWRGYASDLETLGANGFSLDLDGTDDRVEIGNVTVLNSSSAFSLTCWIKSSATIIDTFDIFSGGDGYANGIYLYLTPTGLDFGVGTSYGRYSTALNDGSWKHLAAVYNGSSFAVYINGSPVSISTTNTPPASTVATAGNGSHIASRVDDTREFNGKMDDFAIFNSALTASEVSNIYSGNLYPTTKLSHLYKFENNYNDSKGSLNGTAQGNPTFDSSDKPY